jgi:hypothetical protein
MKTGYQWLTHVILAICEAEIRRILVQSQPGQTVCRDLISKITRPKWTGGGSSGRVPDLQEYKSWVQTPIPPKNIYIYNNKVTP